MNALTATHADLNVVLLLTGVLIGFVGLGLIWFGRSLWAERQAARAERTVVETPEQRKQRLFDAACDRSLAIAAVELEAHRRLSPVGSVLPFPEQRRGES